MMLYKLPPRVLVLALLMLTMAVAQLPAEDELVVDSQNGWFGIYIDGQKVGHAAWALERKEGAKNWYKLTWEETRTRTVGKREVKDLLSCSATLGPSLAPQSLTHEESKAGSKTTVTAQVKDGTATVVMQFAGQNPMPAKTVTMTPETQFGFCAPLAFSWRALPPGKAVNFSRLIESSRTVQSTPLNGKAGKYRFEGKECDVVTWADSGSKIEIVADLKGRLMQLTQVTLGKQTIVHICEREDVALSSRTWEEKKKRDEERKDPEGKKKKELTGADRFLRALDPVASEAVPSTSGDYIKFRDPLDNIFFTMRAQKLWECEHKPEKPHPQFFIYTTLEKQLSMVVTWVKGDTGDAAEILDLSIKDLMSGALFSSVTIVEPLESFKLGTKDCAGIGLKLVHPSDLTYRCFVCLIPGTRSAYMITGTALEDSYDDIVDDFYAMMGSARYE